MDAHTEAEMKVKAADAERLELQKFLADLLAAELLAILLRLRATARRERDRWESQWLLVSPFHRTLARHGSVRLMTAQGVATALLGQNAPSTVVTWGASPRPALAPHYGFPAPTRLTRA